MYTLSRLLPDTKRPIVSGPPGRAGAENEPACCEFLPGEAVEVAWTPAGSEEGLTPTPIAVFALTEQGVLSFVPGRQDCSASLKLLPLLASTGHPEVTMTLLDGDRHVADLGYLEDVRVYIQVFPDGKPKADAPAA